MTQTTIELAIKSLETQRLEIQNAISSLKAQMSGSAAIEETPTVADGGVSAAPVKNKTKRRRKLSAAGKKAISDAAKKRWAAVRKQGRRRL